MSPARECDQCGGIKSIVSVREVCRDCFKRDNRLDVLQHELFESVMAAFSSAHPNTWPRVLDAAHKLMEFYQ